MERPKIDVRYGEFIDIDGPSHKFTGITFAPANVTLLGQSFDSVYPLEEHLQAVKVSPDVKTLVHPGEDAPWVRGRAQRLFLIPNITEEDRPEKTTFSAAFIALLLDDAGAYFGVPFSCDDYYGQTSLMFSSEPGPPEELQKQIAEAFWGLLLSDPDDLIDYKDSMFHHGAAVMVDFGVEDGEPFIEEREPADDDD